jgi:hypothetical protein
MRNLNPSSSTPDSPRSIFKEYFSWIDQFTKWRKFRATRDCIKRGEDLFDLSDDELNQFGLMTPFKFNLYEAILAALPAQVAFKLFDFFLPDKVQSKEVEFGTSFGRHMARDGDKLIDAISLLLFPLLPPLVLLLTAWVASRACLKERDATKLTRERCKRAFYYYNGAYSLMPQTLIALTISFWRETEQRNIDSILVFITFAVLFVIAFPCQLFVVYFKIPNLLFELNGYAKKRFFQSRLAHFQDNQPPYWKYVFDVFGWNGLLSAIAKYILPVLLAFLVIIITFVEVWFRKRLGLLQ